MKIIVTSDLHLGITLSSTLNILAQEIYEERPHVLALGGDLAETLVDINSFKQCIRIFREKIPEIPILVIPGNHDLWTKKEGELDSKSLWEHELQRQTETAGAFWLEEKNWIHDGIAIVGSMLHYDYSARDSVGPASNYGTDYFIRNKKNIINDGRYFHNLPSDIDFAKTIGEAFRERLLSAQNDPEIREIVIITHVPCLEQLITRKPYSLQWAIATPFFGNLSQQELILRCSKVTHVISGHSHTEQRATIKRGNMPNIEAICIGSDYEKPVFEIVQTKDAV